MWLLNIEGFYSLFNISCTHHHDKKTSN